MVDNTDYETYIETTSTRPPKYTGNSCPNDAEETCSLLRIPQEVQGYRSQS